MKTYVITLSKKFPATYKRHGEPTYFWERFNVLATNGNFIHKDYYDHSVKRWVRAVDWSIENITHWMNLPQLPKKGGKEC